jgi:hypothetical protein
MGMSAETPLIYPLPLAVNKIDSIFFECELILYPGHVVMSPSRWGKESANKHSPEGDTV